MTYRPMNRSYRPAPRAAAPVHCSQCGSTDREDLETGDQGYTACCNEPQCGCSSPQSHDDGGFRPTSGWAN